MLNVAEGETGVGFICGSADVAASVEQPRRSRDGDCLTGFRNVRRTENAVAAMEDPARKIYAVEFHPEVNHTEQGTEILRNFLFRVCKAEKKWSGAAFIEETVEAIRTEGGTDGASDLRAERRSGLYRGGGAGTPGDRRAADKYFCEYRNAAEERVRRDAGDVARAAGVASDRGGCVGAISEAVDGCDGSGDKRKMIGAEFIAVFAEEAQTIAAGRSARRDWSFWCRGRCIRT